MKTTPLLEEHLKLKARMAPFAGWNMPIQYEGIIAEHNYTRTAASVFDISHMGEFYVKGDADETGMEKAFSFSVKDMPVGKCRYGAMLNEKGGMIDDLIAYRIAKDEWMIVVNAGAIEKDFLRLKERLKRPERLEDRSQALAKLDMQGPLSRSILSERINSEAAALKYYTFNYFDILGEKNVISRTGYTGELGYELYISAGKAMELWNILLADKRLKPAGLGARDTLRLEMGYTLYGHDVNDDTTPIEAGLERFINLNRDFIGRSALLEQKKSGVKKISAAFMTDSRKSPRRGYSIMKNGRKIGVVTSGSFAPSLSHGIGLGYVETAYAKMGEEVAIEGAGGEMNAIICERPFYKHGTARM